MKYLATLSALLSLTAAACAQDGQVKIGVLNDQSTAFSALGGKDVVEAVKMAVEDFGGQVLGKPIEVVAADQQNKPEVAITIAREWIEKDNVDAMFDIAGSAMAGAINELLGKNKKLGFFVTPLTDRMTEAECNGYGMAWGYDAYSVIHASVLAQMKDGGEKWFLISNDYEGGKVVEKTFIDTIEGAGGTVVQAVRVPLDATDYSSYILQAQASGADVVALTLNGTPLVNAAKQVQEFGVIDGGQRVALSMLWQSDVRAIGREILKGSRFTAPWYWKDDPESIEFNRRMVERIGHAPTWTSSANYSAVMTYLKAVQAAGTDDADQVLAQLRKIEIKDFFAQNATLFPNGRLIHDMHLYEVNAPGGDDPEDVFTKVSTTPAAEAFRPLSDTKCPLVNK